MTSSTKPEVHNVYYVLHCTQMRTKLPSATGSLQRQFGDVVFEIYERTDRQTQRRVCRHADWNTLHPTRGKEWMLHYTVGIRNSTNLHNKHSQVTTGTVEQSFEFSTVSYLENENKQRKPPFYCCQVRCSISWMMASINNHKILGHLDVRYSIILA